MPRHLRRTARGRRLARAWLVLATAAGAGAAVAAEESALPEDPVPLQVDEAPARPRPVLELGSDFLGTGVIRPGFELPGGAVWQPQLLVWGELRTAVQTFDPSGAPDERISEWRNRLDVFGELEVSPTERIVVGFRPLDDNGEFTGCGFEPGDGGCDHPFDPEVDIAFAEGNFGELLPDLDPDESRALDIEFSIGRQPLLFQDGLLIDDNMDSVAITRNNIALPGTTNTRVTALYAFNDIDRGFNREDKDANLAALLVETDVPASTINFDTAVVTSKATRGTSLHSGLSFVQRVGRLSTAVRGLYSRNLNGDSPFATSGGLLFAEATLVPPHTHDNAYVTAFFGIDEFSSAARAPAAGGPLGRTGILFGAVGLGGYGAPLGNDLDDSFGGALGYQMFFHRNRRWLTVEVGGRHRWKRDGARASGGAGLSYRHAIGRRAIARFDSFIGHREKRHLGWGARAEMLLRF